MFSSTLPTSSSQEQQCALHSCLSIYSSVFVVSKDALWLFYTKFYGCIIHCKKLAHLPFFDCLVLKLFTKSVYKFPLHKKFCFGQGGPLKWSTTSAGCCSVNHVVT